MFCVKCHNDLIDCTCPDKEERITALCNSGFFVYRRCKKCGKHYALCKCENPEWEATNERATSSNAQDT